MLFDIAVYLFLQLLIWKGIEQINALDIVKNHQMFW